jgi:hypothetical protein
LMRSPYDLIGSRVGLRHLGVDLHHHPQVVRQKKNNKARR